MTAAIFRTRVSKMAGFTTTGIWLWRRADVPSWPVPNTFVEFVMKDGSSCSWEIQRVQFRPSTPGFSVDLFHTLPAHFHGNLTFDETVAYMKASGWSE